MALHELSSGNKEQSSAACYVVFCESMKGGENILAEPRQGERRGQEADRRPGSEAAAGKARGWSHRFTS